MHNNFDKSSLEFPLITLAAAAFLGLMFLPMVI
ncbi:hypothetical protein MED92_00929 [Oceanospirillum sp. MED92]|uniref:Uncharacterized protein n=1 Tax=Neptuniibacter caesariensis TaxID=207954 RepID=A0A7U8C4X6_NEPCE|nr:hypothetical protein MED92_00929 [Oceanospirillum sp. MED92] [Neptuniibacter caesariensis]